MSPDNLTTTRPTLCDGPTTDTALEAMANLESAKEIELGQVPPLQAAAECWQTAGGAKVSFIADHDRPMFDLALRFRAGNVLDGANPGLAAVTLYSLDQGTGELDAAQFAEQLAGYGAILSRRITDDSAVITLRCLSLPAIRASVMQLFTQMLAYPAFREPDVAKIRERLAFNRVRQGSHPLIRLTNTTMAHVFRDHPYAASATTTASGTVNVEQIRDFHQKAYSANNLDIALVGDLSREDAEQLIDALTRALPQAWAAAAPPPLPEHPPLVQHLTATGSATRALLTLSSKASPSSPLFPALTLLNVILGTSYESRLTQELRTLRSLTYAIYSDLNPLDAACLLQIHWDIAPQYRDAAAALVSGIVACLRERGPSQAECDIAVNEIAAKLHHDLADSAKLAKALATYSHQGLPGDHLATFLDRLQSLTPANLREAGQVWLGNATQVLVTLGPESVQLPLPETMKDDQ
ncbi:pitrilysin family protein [Pseudomonas sp. B22(2017)]|uniref:M16 family metallopeptidase n=1 Tax=Pseudomonas sp. B22(2017) TaxID=1981736 RepID=UPI000A1FA070|nr:pitrilysin family protein [Pseudomonas sp. B22(2017)]